MLDQSNEGLLLTAQLCSVNVGYVGESCRLLVNLERGEVVRSRYRPAVISNGD